MFFSQFYPKKIVMKVHFTNFSENEKKIFLKSLEKTDIGIISNIFQ